MGFGEKKKEKSWQLNRSTQFPSQSAAMDVIRKIGFHAIRIYRFECLKICQEDAVF